jgi:peptide chain release factor 1
MPDFQSIVDEYQHLTEDSADPAKVGDLAEIGERINSLQQKAAIAKEILKLDAQIAQNQELLQDPEMKELAKSDLTALSAQKQAFLNEFQALEENELNTEDSRPAIMEFRPGAGGEEARIWLEDLKRMYLRFAENQGIKYVSLDENTLLFSGRPSDPDLSQGAYGLFKWESGVHRVQRVPETESQGRIHTSTASVVVLPKVDPGKVEIRDDELEWQFFRSGGKGGQNVNKVSTGVRLIHAPSGIIVVSTQERYQQRNREIALDLLRSQLWERQEEERLGQLDTTRKIAVGRGMRAEKIRTYNYPQNRVTDHRVGVSWHSLDTIMEGSLTDLFTTLHREISSQTAT